MPSNRNFEWIKIIIRIPDELFLPYTIADTDTKIIARLDLNETVKRNILELHVINMTLKFNFHELELRIEIV